MLSPEQIWAAAKALITSRDLREVFDTLARHEDADLHAVADAISDRGEGPLAPTGLQAAEWILLVRAAVRHFAATPAASRVRLDELDEVPLAAIVELFGRHEDGDTFAATRAELLAWTVLQARDGELADLPAPVAETLLAAAVLGAEAGARLGHLWRTTIGRYIEDAAHRASTEQHAPFFASTLASYAQRAGAEAAAAADSESIALAYDAIRVATMLDPNDWRLHNEAAVRALDHYERAAVEDAAGAAVAHARAACTASAGNERASFLARFTLARALSALVALHEDECTQDEAVKLWRELADDAPGIANRRGLSAIALNLASELGVVGAKRGELDLIDEAIAVLDSVDAYDAELTLERDLSRGNRLRARYDLTGDRSDIDAAIEWARRAVEISATAPAEVASRTSNNLALKLRDRHRDFGDDSDIDESVQLHGRAVQNLPAGRAEAPRWRANLAHAYRQRAEVTGSLEDLRLARYHAKAALDATPRGTYQYWERVNSHLVAQTAGEDRSPAELDQLIELADGLLEQPAPPVARRRWLANVAALYATRAELNGSRQDAFRALELWDAAIELAAPDSPDFLGLVSSRGSGRMMLADATGSSELLVRAVEDQRHVVEIMRARGGSGPASAVALANYSHALASQGSALLDLAALKEAAATAREALGLTDAGARSLAALSALGNALLTTVEVQSGISGTVERRLADECLTVYRRAVQSLDERDPRFGAHAGNLANGLFQIGLLSADATLLNEATDWYQRATSTDRVAGYAERLTNLGMAAVTVAEQAIADPREVSQIEVARQAFADAESAVDEHRLGVTFRTAVGRARVSALVGDDRGVVAAAEAALDLGVRGLRMASGDYRVAQLRPAEALPALAANAYLRVYDAAAAVAYLERSRSLILRAQVSGMSADRADEPLRAVSTEAVLRLAEDAGEPIVYVLPGRERSFLLICWGHEIRPMEISLRGRDVLAAARRLRFAAPGRPKAAAGRFAGIVDDVVHDLGEWLGVPLSALLAETGSLTLVPVGAFAAFPWPAVMVSGEVGFRPLIALGALRVVSSATLLDAAIRALATRTGESPETAVVVADPGRTDLALLRHAREEGLVVARVLRRAGMTVEPLFDADATVAAVAAAGAAADIGHFACHAVQRPMSSATALLLADGELPGGALERSPSRLAFLSACSTGEVELAVADEGLTLGSSLMARGTATVVSTLWPVDDQASTSLTQRFYERWLDGASAAEALAAAQRIVASDAGAVGRHPWLWGGVTVSGV